MISMIPNKTDKDWFNYKWQVYSCFIKSIPPDEFKSTAPGLFKAQSWDNLKKKKIVYWFKVKTSQSSCNALITE